VDRHRNCRSLTAVGADRRSCEAGLAEPVEEVVDGRTVGVKPPQVRFHKCKVGIEPSQFEQWGSRFLNSPKLGETCYDITQTGRPIAGVTGTVY